MGSTLGGGAGEDPFGGDAYDYALRPEEDDEEEEEEEEQERAPDAPVHARRKSTFQPLIQQELWWMGLSAATVLGLTTAAVVLSVVG